MRGFRFRLETVLRLRERIAEREERELAALLASRAAVERERERVTALMVQFAAAQDGPLRAGAGGSELHLWREWTQAAQGAELHQRRQLHSVEEKIRAQRARYLAAQKEWQTLEQVKSEAHTRWRAETKREEQKQNDGIAITRFRSSDTREA